MGTNKYIESYIKSKIIPELPQKQMKKMKSFEAENTVGKIIPLRQLAIQKITLERNNLYSHKKDIQKRAQDWFKKYDPEF